MSFPPHLLDELARAFARAALDKLLEEPPAREPRQENPSASSDDQQPPPGPTQAIDPYEL